MIVPFFLKKVPKRNFNGIPFLSIFKKLVHETGQNTIYFLQDFFFSFMLKSNERYAFSVIIFFKLLHLQLSGKYNVCTCLTLIAIQRL